MPEPGFYYHYKHDPAGDFTNYAYEVLGVGHHTEEEARPEDHFMVVYRPLYAHAPVYRLGRLYDLRPLAMFMERVEKEGKIVPRFTRIVDPECIARLTQQREEMYG